MCAMYRVLYCDVRLYISKKPPREHKMLGETWATVINSYKQHPLDKRAQQDAARQNGGRAEFSIHPKGDHEGRTREVPQEDRCLSIYIN